MRTPCRYRFSRLFGSFWFGCFLALSLGGAFCPAHANGNRKDAETYVIPFTFDPLYQRQIVVRLSIHDLPPRPFIIDTGTDIPLLLDTQSAQEMGIATDGPKSKFGSLDVTRITIRKMAILGKRRPYEYNEKLTVFVGQLDIFSEVNNTGRIAGIIGLAALATAKMRIDFLKKELVIYYGEDAKLPVTSDMTVIPMRFTPFPARCHLPIIWQNGRMQECILDTGSPFSYLSLDKFDDLSPVASTRRIFATFVGNFQTTFLALSKVQLGNLTEPNPIFVLDPLDTENVVGLDLLQRFEVLLDFPGEKMYLKRAKNYAQLQRLPGTTGIVLERKEGGFFVEEVQPDSVAATAGVRPGDQITAIDEISLATFALQPAQKLLDGWEQTTATLALTRKAEGSISKQLKVRFERASEYEPFVQKNPQEIEVRIGIEAMSTASAIYVFYVQEAGLAKAAGIRAGDRIIAINGKTVEAIGMDNLKEAMDLTKQEALTLTVKRYGEEKERLIRLQAPPGK